MRFEKDLRRNLRLLCNDLNKKTYRHGAYRAFTVCDPKKRQIHKATVRDRVVHQLLVDMLGPVFEKKFIYDSYSCRKGKGTHAGMCRLELLLRRASRNNTQTVYVLKCDVQLFFASVDAVILRQLITRQVHDPDILWLVDTVLASFAPGIPLGNVTSQLFANIYLHELDWYVKQTLRVHGYVRYCDDFALLCKSKLEACEYTHLVGHFLTETLHLRLHPHKVSVRTWRQGVDYLGYVTKPGARLVRTTTQHRMMQKVCKHNQSSYLGICKHADAQRLQRTLQTIAAAGV